MNDAQTTKAKADATHHLPIGLDQSIIVGGFDALSWDFCDFPLFSISYDQGNSVTLPYLGQDKDFDVPDGVTVLNAVVTDYTETISFKSTQCVNEEKFSTSVEASLGVAGVSAKTSYSLARSSRVETDDSETTTTVACYKRIYRFKRDEVDKLSPDFAAALKSLPTSYNPGNDDAFRTFFQKWGTHYLRNGCFGGTWAMNMFITESKFDQLDTRDTQTKVEASFTTGTTSGSAKTDIEQSTMNKLNLDNKTTEIRFHAVGGDSDKEINDWLKSVDAAIMFLDDTLAVTTDADAIAPTFTPIWQLADGALQPALKQAWLAYLPAEQRQDDALPPAIPGQLNANVQAATDGFLGAAANAANKGDGGEIYAVSDANPNPATRRASAGVHQYLDLLSRASEQITLASLFTPVRANDYYNVTYAPRWGTVASGMTFQPFPLDFGDWEQLSFNQTYSGRDRDGFVVASINYGQDGNRGFAIGSQVVNGQMSRCAGSSVHWYESEPNTKVATASFCMPVVRGASFIIELTNTYGSIDGSVFWIPMGSSHRMLPLAFYHIDQVNQAKTHGILTGFVSQDNDQPYNPGNPPATSIVFLQTAAAEDFSNANFVGVATVEYCTGCDKRIQFNSTTAVIGKGSWFRTTIDTGVPCNAVSSWVGIVPV